MARGRHWRAIGASEHAPCAGITRRKMRETSGLLSCRGHGLAPGEECHGPSWHIPEGQPGASAAACFTAWGQDYREIMLRNGNFPKRRGNPRLTLVFAFWGSWRSDVACRWQDNYEDYTKKAGEYGGSQKWRGGRVVDSTEVALWLSCEVRRFLRGLWNPT